MQTFALILGSTRLPDMVLTISQADSPLRSSSVIRSVSTGASLPSYCFKSRMATLHDVAKQAGVSITTVSRVINHPEKVKPETLATVRRAISALDYRPSRVAQRLRDRAGAGELIGLLIPDIQNPFYSGIVRGTEDVAFSRDAATVLCNTDEDADRQQFYLEVLKGESADGILLPPLFRNGRLALNLEKLGLPVVCFDRRIPGDPVDTVAIDNLEGARQMTAHLLGLGHKKIGLIVGPGELSTSVERADGYRKALRDVDAAIDETLIRMVPPRPSASYDHTLELMAMDEPPTAIFAGNNQLALGVISAIMERKLLIPDDVAVVGFDDAPWAKVLSPPLTTIRQPTYEMGRRAAELLFSRMAQPNRMPALITLRPELIIRRSCGTA